MTGRALVLGAGGFLGSHLCRRLLRSGWHVTGVVRDREDGHLKPRLQDLVGDLELVEGSADDTSLLNRLVVGTDAIFPFAGRSGATASMADPLADLAANGASQLKVLEAVRRHAKEARLVFPGSRLQYGRPLTLPVTEEHPAAPRCVYGMHKALGEGYHLLYSRIYGVETCSLRISLPYGPWQDRADAAFGVVGTFLATAARGGTIQLYGGGHQLRDYVFVEDLCELVEVAATSPLAVGEVFNAGGPQATSIRDMAAAVIETVSSGEIADVPWPPEAEAVETGDWITSSEKAAQVLGWRPTTSLGQGLAVTWEALMPALETAR
ncbi:MAG: NAD-dependent epimerase/dehydratase family protein [Mycobacteriales bacterium]